MIPSNVLSLDIPILNHRLITLDKHLKFKLNSFKVFTYPLISGIGGVGNRFTWGHNSNLEFGSLLWVVEKRKPSE